MSQPVLLKVYGGFMPASPRLHEALRQIAGTALPAENVCVALDGDMASLSFEGIYFPLEETLEAIREYANEETRGRLGVLDIENWTLCRHEINGKEISARSQGLNSVLDYSGF